MNASTEKRRYLSDGEKVRVIQIQDGICSCHEDCDSVLEIGHIRYDHILPLWLGGTNKLDNFQALTTGHHQSKTNKEASERAKGNRTKAKHEGTYKNKRQQAMERMLGN
jgi:5-methylcytosine-specific restriction endonuclease McrA